MDKQPTSWAHRLLIALRLKKPITKATVPPTRSTSWPSRIPTMQQPRVQGTNWMHNAAPHPSPAPATGVDPMAEAMLYTLAARSHYSAEYPRSPEAEPITSGGGGDFGGGGASSTWEPSASCSSSDSYSCSSDSSSSSSCSSD